MVETLAVDVMKMETLKLHVPSLTEAGAVLEEALRKNFSQVEVNAVECPDLTDGPYRLAAKGLCGSPRIVDVGGVKYLAPVPQLKHKYDLKEIATLIHLPHECLLIGAGAGPYGTVGCNCELMANIYMESSGPGKILSQVAKLDKDGKQEVQQLPSTELAILGNFLASEGKTGPVLEVIVRGRTGADNFVSCMRRALANKYPGTPVGMGGVFFVPSGKLNIHIMPEFSKEPLKTEGDVDKWLRYFDFQAPMVFFSVFVSEDPGMDLRVEHTHGHSVLNDDGACQENSGGHYHYDVTPEEVEYVGYFNIAELLYRIDRPSFKL